MVNNVSSRYTNFFRKNAKIPNSTIMWTKGQCKLSEQELVSKIVDLAHRDAAAGKNSLHDDCKIGSEWNTLFHNYISLSSPDRAGIIQKKLTQLTGGAASMSLKSNSRIEAFAILFANSRRHKHDPDVGQDYIIFRDEYGKEVATYSKQAGWVVHNTPAESARTHAFIELWNQALSDAQEELEQEPSGDGDIIFEARA